MEEDGRPIDVPVQDTTVDEVAELRSLVAGLRSENARLLRLANIITVTTTSAPSPCYAGPTLRQART